MWRRRNLWASITIRQQFVNLGPARSRPFSFSYVSCHVDIVKLYRRGTKHIQIGSASPHATTAPPHTARAARTGDRPAGAPQTATVTSDTQKPVHCVQRSPSCSSAGAASRSGSVIVALEMRSVSAVAARVSAAKNSTSPSSLAPVAAPRPGPPPRHNSCAGTAAPARTRDR